MRQQDKMRTYRRHGRGYKKTLRKQRGGAAQSGCVDPYNSLLRYHLHADIQHDFTVAIAGTPPVSNIYGGPEHTRREARYLKEDAVVEFFKYDNDDTVKSFIEKRDERIAGIIRFTIQQETAVFGNYNMKLRFARPKVGESDQLENTDVAMIQDAGKQLFTELGATNLLTFGSILDQAGKPISPKTSPYYYPLADKSFVDIDPCEYGIDSKFVKKIRIYSTREGNLVKCLAFRNKTADLRGNEYIWVDMISLREFPGIDEGGAALIDDQNWNNILGKKINNTTFEESGYFSSINQINDVAASQLPTKLRNVNLEGRDTTIDERMLYLGKALGDSLLVASAQNIINIQRPAEKNLFLPVPGMEVIRFAAGYQPEKKTINYIVFKTGDRLNHIRAFIKGVPTIYEEQSNDLNATKTFEYIPAPDGLVAADVIDYYHGQIKALGQQAQTIYTDVVKELNQAALDGENFKMSFSQFSASVGEVLKIPGKGPEAAKMIKDIAVKLNGIGLLVKTFFETFEKPKDEKTALSTYNRMVELFKLLTPPKQSFKKSDTETVDTFVILRITPKVITATPELRTFNSDPANQTLLSKGLFGSLSLRLSSPLGYLQKGDDDWKKAKSGTELDSKFYDFFVEAAKGGQVGGARTTEQVQKSGELEDPNLYENGVNYTLLPISQDQEKDAPVILLDPSETYKGKLDKINLSSFPLLSLFHSILGKTIQDTANVIYRAIKYEGKKAIIDSRLLHELYEQLGDFYATKYTADRPLTHPGYVTEDTKQTISTLTFNKIVCDINESNAANLGLVDCGSSPLYEPDNDLARRYQKYSEYFNCILCRVEKRPAPSPPGAAPPSPDRVTARAATRPERIAELQRQIAQIDERLRGLAGVSSAPTAARLNETKEQLEQELRQLEVPPGLYLPATPASTRSLPGLASATGTQGRRRPRENTDGFDDGQGPAQRVRTEGQPQPPLRELAATAAELRLRQQQAQRQPVASTPGAGSSSQSSGGFIPDMHLPPDAPEGGQRRRRRTQRKRL
jgi:hypothetical protein